MEIFFKRCQETSRSIKVAENGSYFLNIAQSPKENEEELQSFAEIARLNWIAKFYSAGCHVASPTTCTSNKQLEKIGEKEKIFWIELYQK